MNKMGMMKGKKETMKSKIVDKKMKAHHTGKGTRARLNTAAEKSFFRSQVSK